MAQTVTVVWKGTPGMGVPRAQRRACRYDAYIPDLLDGLEVSPSADVAADVSDAERAIQRLNVGGPALASLEALARLLLRAEATASARWLALAASRTMGLGVFADEDH